MLPHHDILHFSQRLFDRVFRGRTYEDELFLCGGTFKTLLSDRLPVNDVDLWVRGRKERERLRAKLEFSGAELRRDFKPYCIKFDQSGLPVEINYQNVNENPIGHVLDGFDLGVCCVAVTYEKGRAVECLVNEKFHQSARDRTVYLQDKFLPELQWSHAPSLLRSIDRMEKAASELNFVVCKRDQEALWDLFEDYTEMEKRECVNNYLETMVGYKGRCNATTLRRAVSQLRSREEAPVALPS